MSTATSELIDLVARRLVQAHYPGDTRDRWSGLAELTKGAYRKQAEYVIAAGFVLPLEHGDGQAAAFVLADHQPEPGWGCRCGWRGGQGHVAGHQAEMLAAAGVLHELDVQEAQR
jgi:hypothetical protein